MNVKASQFGYQSDLPAGKFDQITDVAGIRVGHTTIDHDTAHTGLTVIIPPGDVYQEPLIAACHVQNGFGKTTGLMQIDELGSLETPIVLTNTLNVGKICDALIEHVLKEEASKGIEVTTVNPVVGECNDSQINRIGNRVLGLMELEEAFKAASVQFEEGSVGAGRGAICYGLKGGIGSASRLVSIGGRTYTFGILVQSNFGRTRNFRFGDRLIGPGLEKSIKKASADDRGSIMMIVATDCPLSARQLKRVVRRVPNGLARTGSYTGNGSGEVVIGFSTANRLNRNKEEMTMTVYPDAMLERAFLAVTDMCQEAVYNSMLNAVSCAKLDGSPCLSLRDLLDKVE